MSSHVLFVDSSVCGCSAVESFRRFSSNDVSCSQSLKINFGSLSETMESSRPCNRKIFLKKQLVTSIAKFFVCEAMKCSVLERLSTHVVIQSLPAELSGRLVIKSIKIDPHRLFVFSRGRRSPRDFVWPYLQVEQINLPAQYVSTSSSVVFQKNFLVLIIVLFMSNVLIFNCLEPIA